MLSANIIEKGEGKAESTPPVSSIHEINAERAELDVMMTTSPDIGSVADIGVQAAMEFLTADKVIVSHEDAENDMNQGEGMHDPGIQTKDEKVEEEIILEQDFIKVAEPGNDKSGDVIPKKKRARLSRLGQRLARPMTDVGSPSTALTKQPNALPPGLANEPPKETLEEFTTSLVWLWDEHINVAFYYLRKKIRQYPELEQRKVTTVDIFFSAKVRGLWSVYQRSPVTFDWDSLKLELTNWTIEVYDSLQHNGTHNSKVRGGVEALSKFIPLLAKRLSLFEFKPREPSGTYPIPVTIMTDIPRQGNGDVRYWVIQERMQIFREWMACYLWGHASRKLEGQYKSDDDVDMGF
ncbi:hypothetical protein TIFTF001_042659 [Ficus carica]|uniref:Uncharacterized protein n=1 Tax=Ficus carica TaxID=3494 RepID=A0AA88D0D2_FICCA|nr:hypothetical protein TIFTF001_042659 [Ficus carica]